ncbi:MAG: type IV pilus twitching motility protein PilT [Candidatus Thorarchaeota archaeon]|jgi:twitching motility protein PilT
MDIHKFLEITVKNKASDLHLKANSVPTLRIDGVLAPIRGEPPLTSMDTLEAFESLTEDKQREIFYKENELDFAYNIPGIARFRVNIAMQRQSICLSLRLVPVEVPTIEQLGLPEVCKALILKPRGLVLVTGPTGCGKSTTLAAMINYLNEQERKTVICIEDPIEFVHKDKNCFVIQRELGGDTQSFTAALIHSLRHDPDVILVGEMRNLETMSTAITAAETGHLVLSTLHTIGAAATIDRIIDVFPSHQQLQIRAQLAIVLQGVLTQVLLPRADRSGRIASFEMMLGNYAIGNLIREARIHEIPGILEVGSQQGMQTMDQGLEQLVKAGLVNVDEALTNAHRPDVLRGKLLHYTLKTRSPKGVTRHNR